MKSGFSKPLQMAAEQPEMVKFRISIWLVKLQYEMVGWEWSSENAEAIISVDIQQLVV